MSTSKTRVLIVCYDLMDGGSPRVIVNLLNFLDKGAFDLRLLLFDDRRAYTLRYPVPTRVISIRGGGSLRQKISANLRAAIAIARAIREEAPEIVLTSGGITNWDTLLGVVGRRRRPKIVVGEHGAGAERLRKDRATVGLQRWLTKWLYKRADRIVAVSEGVRRSLAASARLRPDSCDVIYNPIDVEQILHLSMEDVPHPWFHRNIPVVVTTGRIEPLKGFDCLVRAFRLVRDRCEARCVIIGDGSEKRALQALVRNQGLELEVDLVGYRANPFSFMRRATVFAFPSLAGEGFPMVLAEAMVCGAPVVSTDCVAGPSEILQQGHCGMLVPVANEGALADGLLRLLRDDNLREQYRSRGAQRANDFAAARVAARYGELFNELIDGADVSSSKPCGAI
jgi:glycosyltransferase involved in cell wall biosynthesis